MILNDSQRLIQETILHWIHDNVINQRQQWAKDSKLPDKIISELGALGFMGLMIPEQWGGAETDTLCYATAIETLAWGDAALSTVVCVHNSVATLPINRFGTAAQKESFLKPLAQGTQLGCFCLTEPQAGSDASELQTTAVRQGDHYVLNGNKQFITSGQSADIALVFAKTDPALGKKGISCFIVPTQTPGFEVVRLENKMGQTAAEVAQLRFDNLQIPADNLLGAENQGYQIALSQLVCGRIGIAAQSLGIAKAALDKALSYAKERETFGQLLIKHQAIGFKLADMLTHYHAAQQLVWHAATLADSGQDASIAAAMAKKFATETGETICREAIQILGGYGYLADFEVERFYRDIRACSIYEGATEIQNMIIQRHLTKHDH